MQRLRKRRLNYRIRWRWSARRWIATGLISIAIAAIIRRVLGWDWQGLTGLVEIPVFAVVVSVQHLVRHIQTKRSAMQRVRRYLRLRRRS